MSSRVAIDRLRAPDGTLDRAALRQILPYGEEFLFVDRVTELDAESLRGSFRVPDDAPYLRAHFVDLPVMPGALVAEGWAQAGTVLVRYNLEEHRDKVILGMQIERTRFDSPVLPGEELLYSVRLKALDRRAARIEGETRTEDRKVATLRVVVGIQGREAFRDIFG